MTNFYLKATCSSLMRFNPFIKKEKRQEFAYNRILKESYEQEHSLILTTLLLNLGMILLTVGLDLLVYFDHINYWFALLIHLPVLILYCLNFSLFENFASKIFLFIFMVVALFIFEYWSLTLLFCIVGMAFVHDIFYN